MFGMKCWSIRQIIKDMVDKYPNDIMKKFGNNEKGIVMWLYLFKK